MSKWTDEVHTKEAVHEGSAIFEDGGGSDQTLKVFPGAPKTLEVGVWWNGNDGEWIPEYLTANLDRADVKDLRDTLDAWLKDNQ